METPNEITQKVEEQENLQFGDLFTRMDEDFELWNMTQPPVTAYEAGVQSRSKAHASDIDVVSNDLRTFSDSVQSILASADMQPRVRMAETTGEDKREDIGKLERLFTFAFEKADERLRRLLLPPVRETEIWYSLIRGWVAIRVLVYRDGGNVIFNFMPLDPRRLVYQTGANGLLWVAHKTSRTRVAIEDEYGVKVSDEKDNTVIDYWNLEDSRIWNKIICKDFFLKEPEVMDVPSMPILIMPVSTRPPVGDNAKDYGESIFAPTRKVNALRNRFASIVATHASLLANQPVLNYRDDMGKDIDLLVNVPGRVLNLPMGHNRVEVSPMKEISPTVVNILNWLNSQMEQGTLPKIPLGPQFPSGTMYNLAESVGTRIFNPQLRNLSYFYADICHLIEEQLIAGKLKVKVQGKEKDKYYETQVTPVDLKKPHTISVEFTARTPWSELDAYQVADMAKRLGVPDEWIWENILKFPDPKGMKDLASIEIAEHSPKLAMYNSVQSLIRYGRLEEALQLMEDLAKLEMQEQQQTQIPQGMTETRVPPAGQPPAPPAEEYV